MRQPRNMLIGLAATALALALLYALSRLNYLLFHCIVELFSLVVISSIGLLLWNSRKHLDNPYLLFLGVALPFIGTLVLLHALAYRGMGVFDNPQANSATQLWIAQRVLTCGAFLAAPLFFRRRLRPLAAGIGFFVVTGGLIASIFLWRNFPDCFIEGAGQTRFKIASELVIAAGFLLAILHVLVQRGNFDRTVRRLVIAAMTLGMLTDLSFTLYTDVYGLTNMLGHLINVASLYMIYQAIIVTGITHPQDLLYRNLKLSEEAFRVSEQRFRALVENAPLAILLLDGPEFRIKWANRAYPHLIGGALEGSKFESLLSPEDRDGMMEILRRTAGQRKPQTEHDWPLHGLTPQIINYWQVAAIPLPEPETAGAEPMLMVLLLDVTDRTLARIKLEELAARLERMNRAKDDFMAMLGHELRNPLAPIQNSIHVLALRGEVNDDQRRQIAIIERQVRHMARLVDDLLDVSRITQGKIELRRQAVNLNRLAQQAAESCQALYNARHHNLTLHLPEEPVMLHADPARLEQILVNLLNNAAKYTEPDGQVWLGVQQDPDTVTIRVRDTGEGLTREMLTEIFEPFSQAERSLDRSQGGLGLGLTLVRNLVRMHGGSVEARSEGLGRGSEFIVTLPAGRNEPEGVLGEGETEVEPETEPGAPLRVLLIEDNEDAAASLSELLKIWGHEASVAHEGRQAVAQALAFRPDVILLDIGLPDMDGLAVARLLRAEPALGGVWIAAITGRGQHEDQRRSREAGIDQHFAKPIDLRELRAMLARCAEAPASRR